MKTSPLMKTLLHVSPVRRDTECQGISEIHMVRWNRKTPYLFNIIEDNVHRSKNYWEVILNIHTHKYIQTVCFQIIYFTSTYIVIKRLCCFSGCKNTKVYYKLKTLQIIHNFISFIVHTRFLPRSKLNLLISLVYIHIHTQSYDYTIFIF